MSRTPSIHEKDRWELLYREWEYRHRTLWASFNLWGFIISILIAMPFINPSLFEVGWPILSVPVFGFGVCLIANFHILSEAKRSSLVFARFSALRDVGPWPYDADSPRTKHKVQTLSFSKIMGNAFLYVLAPCCLSSILVQSVILYNKHGSPLDFSAAGYLRFGAFFLAFLLPALGGCLGVARALSAERRRLKARESDGTK